MPGLARLFIGLAVLDVVGRLVVVLGPPMYLPPHEPLALLSNVLPRDLWIALPAIVVQRRADAARAIPWIFRGALTLSLTTLFVEPVGVQLATTLLEPYPAVVVVEAVSSVLLIVAWLMLAKGFGALGPRPSAPAVAALATFVAAAFVLGAAVNIARLVANSGGIASPDFEPEMFALSTLFVLGDLATGAALWAISRGLGDLRRPVRATRLAGAAATTWGLAVLLGSLGTVWFLLNRPLPDYSEGLAALEGLVGWMTAAVAPAMLAAAIAIGLIDRGVDGAGPDPLAAAGPE